MESSIVTSVFLPLALGIIMLGLGLSLTLADFKRVVVMPKAIIVGLVCQMLILPFVCYGIAKAVGLPPVLAVGLMLLAASPGGATANLFSHLAKGDVALNITLTAVNSVLSVISLPIIVNLSMKLFMQESATIPLQVKEVLQVFAVVLVPTGIGMLVRAKKLNLALRMEKPVRIASAVFLVLIIAAAVAGQRQNLVDFFKQVGIAALLFNLASMGLGYLIPRLVRLSKRQSVAIGMEVGIHNGTLAIVIATTLLNNAAMSIPAAIYSLIMFFTAAGFAFIVNRSKIDEEPAAG
ncbi:MAG: bile acid:sodium symporter family protein [Polyangiaceae bacterium]|nr:bile acid:sodium symporter family protein [Polyangiaceae bacterium]MCW5788794.1 bile acid:sodium symporter family protein [Polyangiaceae bacterium]